MDFRRFEDLDYDDFRRLATEEGLSASERIGFPESYRAGKTEAILADIGRKLPAFGKAGRTLLDIGVGCGELGQAIVALARESNQDVILVDAPEVLARLDPHEKCHLIPGRFPDEVSSDLAQWQGTIDAVLVYSVFHYVFEAGQVLPFLDACLDLIAPGGSLLIGDIPNLSKRRRFFASEAGVRFHQEFMQTTERPVVDLTAPTDGHIDDALLMRLMAHARARHFDAYLVPQSAELPMANRREDLLVSRP